LPEEFNKSTWQTVGNETGLRTARFGARTPTEARKLSLLQNVQNRSEAHPASYSGGTGVLLWDKVVGE